MKRQQKLLWVTLFLAALLLSACGAPSPDTAENEVQPPATAENSAQPAGTTANDAQPSPTGVDEAIDLSERTEFSGFSFSIAYLAGWMADARGPVTIINELAGDHQTAFRENPPDREGYEVSLDHRDLTFMRSIGLPEEASLQDLFEMNREFFEWPASLEPTETEAFGAPALGVRTNDDGAWGYQLMGFVDEETFLLSINAPSEAALDAFLPTWQQMLDSIEPVALQSQAPTDAPALLAEAADESITYDLLAYTPLADFGYTMPYPAAWFAETSGNQVTISSTEAQLDPPLTQPPIEGYSIDFFYDSLSAMQSGGLAADPTLQDLLDFLVASFGAEEPTLVEETTLFDVPAIRARSSISFEGEPAHPFEVTTGIRGDHVFLLVLHAPGENELEAFLPSWREILYSIEAADTSSAEAAASTAETAAAGWEMITSQGDNVCADGSPAAVWVRPGDEKKLFIYFQGPYHNTFCSDAENCDLNGRFPWIDPAIHLSEQFDQEPLRDNFADEPQRIEAGMLDLANPDNPLFGYTAVYVPYCTGDLFMGDVTRTYTREDGSTFDINHHGYTNAQAVLNMVYENLSAPEQILIAGCEAGAPGALLNAPSLIEHYPDASVVQLSESFAGIFPEPIDFDAAWDVRQNLPASLSDLPDPFTITDLTAAIAQQYPQARFAQFNYTADGVQATAYSTGGLPAGSGQEIAYEEFARELAASQKAIHAAAPNFHSFTLEGANEQALCALDSSLAYWLKGGDTYYVDWLSALLAGQDTPDVAGAFTFEAR